MFFLYNMENNFKKEVFREESDMTADTRYAALIEAFHKTWEYFPGQARLINAKHHVIAVNAFAAKKRADARRNLRCFR